MSAPLASALAGAPAAFVSADVALDAADLVVGSFTAEGLTYAVGPEGLTLVSADAAAVSDGAIAIPASATYGGAAYGVTAVGAFAFYLSGATSVNLPASVASVDERAFRSSDVAWVEVGPSNETYASYDGVLYGASLTRLLLIPGGRQGAVRIDRHAEGVEPSAFSHCAGVDAISVDAGSADLASWDGLLYDASGTTLLRVPAGATDITIHDGCTTIAAGALEGCAKLEHINAPASVTSISPDVFAAIPTIALPAASVSSSSAGAEGEAEVSPRRVVASSQGLEAPLALPDLGSTSASPSSEAEAQTSLQDEASSGVASSLLDQVNVSADSAPQLTAMVALSSVDDDLPEVDPSSIEVILSEGADAVPWQAVGFPFTKGDVEVLEEDDQGVGAPLASLQDRTTSTYALVCSAQVDAKGGYAIRYNGAFSQIDSNSVYRNIPVYGNWTLFGTAEYGGFQYHPSDSDEVWTIRARKTGYAFTGWSGTHTWRLGQTAPLSGTTTCVVDANWKAIPYTIILDAQGGTVSPMGIAATYDQDATLPAPTRTGYKFLGWNTAADGAGTTYQAGAVRNLTTTNGATVTLYAQWKVCEIGFDTDSEPDDADYPGEAKDPISAPDAAGPDGTIEIEDPKRPGYVFEGWVIPNGDGTEAIDQDLVYQDKTDGKWYVDASKLPDYAGDDGRVELTARWTSVISVDVPSSVTFYADLVTQGQESREGAAEGAFGQSKVENQSEVDLRIVGLESSAVKTEGSTLGADSILKKASAATPATSTQKLLSLYPSTKQWTADDLKDPDAVGGTKAATAVDFDLDDILLEKSFSADDFTIAAGGTLNMGYRLNLSETGQQLDYDKLSTLSEGQSASIANVSYCFAADALPSDWDEPLWIENPDRTSNPAKYLLLKDIKAAADDLSANGTASEYYSLYKGLLDAGTDFHLKVDNAYYEVNILGICQDTRSDNGKRAGLTFGYRESFPSALSLMSGSDNLGGWQASGLRRWMRSSFMDMLGEALKDPATGIVGVNKPQQLGKGDGAGIQMTYGETIWEPSMFEVFGFTQSLYNEAEAASGAFQYQWFAKGGWTQGVPNMQAKKLYRSTGAHWWLRSARSSDSFYFALVTPSGEASATYAYTEAAILPCFCL